MSRPGLDAVPAAHAHRAPPGGIVETLAVSPFFADLDAPRLERVAALARREAFPAGGTVYRVGDPANAFYALVEGLVRFELYSGERPMTAGQISRPGEVFGWTGLAEHIDVRMATAFCVQPVSTVTIDAPGLLALMDEDHDLGYFLFKRLSSVITGTLTAFAAG